MKVRNILRSLICRAIFAGSLASAAFCSGAAHGQTTEQDRLRLETQTVEWFNDMNSSGPSSRLATGVAESVRSALQGGRHAHVMVPAEFSSDGKAHYAVTYGGLLHDFELTPAQADQLGLGSEGVVIQEGPYRPDVKGMFAVAQVERLAIDGAENMTTDREITGSVVVRMYGASTENLKLRVAYKRNGSTRTMTKPLGVIPADGRIDFSITKIDAEDDDSAHKGPLPLFVDVVQADESDAYFGEDEDSVDTVVSNTVSTLLDIKAGGGIAGTAWNFNDIAGTTWKFGGSESTVTFYANGEVDFSDTEAGGQWNQSGDTLSFDCNDFTLFEVTIQGGEMTGTWRRLKGDDTSFTAPTSLTRVASIR